MLTWANVFVFPTYYHSEGQPIALLEAMATGNTIITTKHAGIPEILTNENAFFVDIKSPDQIASVLREFDTNKQSFKSKSMFNYIDSRKYTEEAFVDNILEVINAK